MKKANTVIVYFIGVLFIFSGAVKLNDPHGTAIKLEEYFDVFAQDFATFFEVFIPFALPLAVFVCILEVMLGVALLVRFKMKSTLWVLLALIVFFTFLTFYSAVFDKVTDCGCFGDAIPLTPWQSFMKDLVLLVLILVLVAQHSRFDNTSSKKGNWIMGGALVLCLGVTGYVLTYLPIIDFRYYKVGNSISQMMQPQADCQYEYVMLKDGEEVIMQEYPTEEGYEFKDMRILNESECLPKILDYNIIDSEGNDFTDESLSGKKLVIVVHQVRHTDFKSYPALNELIANLEESMPSVDPMVFTSEAGNFEIFRHEVQLAVPYYYGDETVLKAMIRSNPGILLLEDGTVKGKWSANNIPTVEEIQASLEE